MEQLRSDLGVTVEPPKSWRVATIKPSCGHGGAAAELPESSRGTTTDLPLSHRVAAIEPPGSLRKLIGTPRGVVANPAWSQRASAMV